MSATSETSETIAVVIDIGQYQISRDNTACVMYGGTNLNASLPRNFTKDQIIQYVLENHTVTGDAPDTSIPLKDQVKSYKKPRILLELDAYERENEHLIDQVAL